MEIYFSNCLNFQNVLLLQLEQECCDTISTRLFNDTRRSTWLPIYIRDNYGLACTLYTYWFALMKTSFPCLLACLRVCVCVSVNEAISFTITCSSSWSLLYVIIIMVMLLIIGQMLCFQLVEALTLAHSILMCHNSSICKWS